MHALEDQFPPLARALGRLGQARNALARPAAQPRPGPVLRPSVRPGHDLLRLMPEPALADDAAAPGGRAELRFGPEIPGPEAARTYWFDL